MRLATFEADGLPRVGAVRAGRGGELEVVDLRAQDPRLPESVKSVLEQSPSVLSTVARAIEAGPAIPLQQAKLLAPVLDPQKIICVGLNYADHAAETGTTAGEEPVIFSKFPTTLRGPEAPIELPPESNEVDYEAELVVVIGKRARRVTRQEAWDYVAGYACGHDVSARKA
jgi:2-keto-4-pentenoate hydratase/2-oxohepta-3-ene-1,7-dioic acid hydratase in catechol pathway